MRNFAWTCDAVSLSCLGYADDVLLFSGSKASLEKMIEDCCAKFGEAGLEVGLDKTHWSSSIAMDGETLVVRGQSIVWERKLEFIGSVIELGAHSGGAVRHRTQKASSVFCKWKPLLCNPNLSLKERMKAFGCEHSFECYVAEWLLDFVEAKQEQASESWCARLLSQMVGFKRNPNDDFVTFWKKLHRKGHELARIFAVSPVDLYLRTKHRLAGHFARFESDNPVYQMMESRNLAWWRQEQLAWGKTKFGGAHPQRFNSWRWESCLERAYGCSRPECGGDPRAVVGLLLHRTSASGKLVKVHFSPHVADFV